MLKLISWDDFWVRVTQVTADDISSIQMVNVENVREYVPNVRRT
jgi:hypothetical protein